MHQLCLRIFQLLLRLVVPSRTNLFVSVFIRQFRNKNLKMEYSQRSERCVYICLSSMSQYVCTRRRMPNYYFIEYATIECVHCTLRTLPTDNNVCGLECVSVDRVGVMCLPDKYVCVCCFVRTPQSVRLTTSVHFFFFPLFFYSIYKCLP